MKIVISGYGKMGHMVETCVLRRGLEAIPTEDVCAVPDELASESVCIDFTTPEAFRNNYKELARKFKAVVVGTTGWNDIKEDVFAEFEKAGKTLIWASNFSIGVNAYFAALQRLCEVLSTHGYTPSVEEIHHIHKLDAPSGTAKSIGEIIEKGISVKPEITSQRVGEVPGTHTSEFVSSVDKITFTHEAFSREGFAEGAVVAALMCEQVKGVHEFKEIIL